MTEGLSLAHTPKKKNTSSREFPGGPMVRTQHFFTAKCLGSIPDQEVKSYKPCSAVRLKQPNKQKTTLIENH